MGNLYDIIINLIKIENGNISLKSISPIKKLLNLHNFEWNHSIPQLIYSILHGSKLCDNCKSKTEFINFKSGYRDYCSTYCSANSLSKRNKIKNTNNKKYGVDNVSKIDSIKIKKRETLIKHYGYHSPILNEQHRKVLISNNKSKYGTDWAISSDIVKNEIKKSFLKKYDCQYPKQIGKDIRGSISYIKNIPLEKFDISEMLEMYNISITTAYRLINKYREDIKEKKLSKIETEFSKLFNNVLVNDRSLIKPLEIDFLIKEFNIAIEYNGLMFHSEGKNISDMFSRIDKKYHLNKTNLVESKGYQLFHIFENEWLDETKKQIWISMLKSKMNKTERIYARKCEIRLISSKDSRIFLEKNHIQGSTKTKLNYGLYHNNELVSLMTFGKARFSKQYEYELLRFCNKLNTTVVGGFSKLLKHFETHYKPKSLVSYANRRWSTGNVYEKNGFTFSHDSNPNYFYFKDSKRIHSRNKFQKHKLKHQLDDFDESLTESENMFNNGYRRIWDCGNKVYHKYFNTNERK